ncbi:MAG: phasin family protein [Burkholderiaceae bacterium]|jgi:poly(hydroxyalkanoate) granule-associated protein
MAKKHRTNSGDAKDGPLASTIRESASQIWLAGLGAFSKAQAEGGKVFEALVKEGGALQRHTRKMTEDKVSEVSEKVSRAAGDLSRQANGTWDKLEQAFEDRVARTLKTLGVPTSKELQALSERLDALSGSGRARRSAPQAATKRASKVAPKKSVARAPTAKKAGAKKTTRRRTTGT